MAGKARQLRQAAQQAHAQAAATIEHLQNDARELGPLVLDLHGLHAAEAVDAVARRCLFSVIFETVLHKVMASCHEAPAERVSWGLWCRICIRLHATEVVDAVARRCGS